MIDSGHCSTGSGSNQGKDCWRQLRPQIAELIPTFLSNTVVDRFWRSQDCNACLFSVFWYIVAGAICTAPGTRTYTQRGRENTSEVTLVCETTRKGDIR